MSDNNENKIKHVWAPWRMKYIQQEEKPEGCFFCEALKDKDCSENLVVKRGKKAFVILNRYPYTSGHVMVVPFEHKGDLEDFDEETLTEIMHLIKQAIDVISREYHPDGFNVGANLGYSAGAGVADHVHFHVVPRWGGDTNFITSVSNTRVLPEDLENTYQRINENWPKDK